MGNFAGEICDKPLRFWLKTFRIAVPADFLAGIFLECKNLTNLFSFIDFFAMTRTKHDNIVAL
jgi:hypothetical protein